MEWKPEMKAITFKKTKTVTELKYFILIENYND